MNDHPTPSVDEVVAAAKKANDNCATMAAVDVLGVDEKIARAAVEARRRDAVDPSPEQVARVGAIIRRGNRRRRMTE